MVDEIEYKTKVNLFLMEREEWGACFTHVWGTDRIQHELWHVVDPEHPRHDPEEARVSRDRVFECGAFRSAGEAYSALANLIRLISTCVFSGTMRSVTMVRG